MIIYFSGTGNCEFAAQKIASATGDMAISITEIGDKLNLNENENLGIITPTYFWGLPSIVDEFLSKIEIINKNSYIFCVASYGTTCGCVSDYINEKLKAKGLKLSASYAVKTVDNYTRLFSVNDKKKIEKTLTLENEKLTEIIDNISKKAMIFNRLDKKSRFMCDRAKYFYENARKTKNFKVLSRCLGCGICAKNCPEKAIEMINGKPVWVKEKCALCFRCLHHCPAFAIQNGKKTEKRGQFVHPEFKGE